jgi:hypothetical protein
VRSHPNAATPPPDLRASLRRAAAGTSDELVSGWLSVLAEHGEFAAVTMPPADTATDNHHRIEA